jgi:hypothetical protein
MNRITVGDVKRYLGLDGEENNQVLAVLLPAAEHLVEKVLRKPIKKNTSEIVKTAVLFTVWQLYFHRDNKEFDPAGLENTLAIMLSDLRRKEF